MADDRPCPHGQVCRGFPQRRASPAARYLWLAGDVGAAIGDRDWSLVPGGERVSMTGGHRRRDTQQRRAHLGVAPRALAHRADQEADELVVTETMSQRKARREPV